MNGMSYWEPRGVMLELAISRLKTISPSLQIWGISATIGNLDEAIQTLLGTDRCDQAQLICSDIKKEIEVISVLPDAPERMPWAGHLGTNLLPQVVARHS